MAGVRIRALTERHPIKPTSPRCHSAWQLNLGRHSTYRRGKSVQTTGTTSIRAGRPPGSPLIPRVADLVDAGYVKVVTTDLTMIEIAKKHAGNDFELMGHLI